VDADELERERGVVIQEIARYEDQPSSVAGHLIDSAAFGDHPLGRRILGPTEHLKTFTREAILAFRERRWAPQDGGAFLAGDLSRVDMAGVEELFMRFPARPDPPPVDPAPSFERRIRVERRDSHQSHLRLHWRSPIEPADPAQRAALSVYSTLLGGSMGSRLFDEIREQRGLCYAIRAGSGSHRDTSLMEVSSGLDSSKCPEAYTRIREIVSDLTENGPSEEEVERARAYAAGGAVLAYEGSGPVARRAAAEKVTFGQVRAPEEAIAALDAVSFEEVREVARGIGGEPTVACVGPHDVGEFE